MWWLWLWLHCKQLEKCALFLQLCISYDMFATMSPVSDSLGITLCTRFQKSVALTIVEWHKKNFLSQTLKFGSELQNVALAVLWSRKNQCFTIAHLAPSWWDYIPYNTTFIFDYPHSQAFYMYISSFSPSIFAYCDQTWRCRRAGNEATF